MREINKAIIHCSDSPYGNADLIKQWHLARGWTDIGYHYVILNAYPTKEAYRDETPQMQYDGIIEPGRDINTIGAHTKGSNKESIGICLIGQRAFTGLQIKSLIHICNQYPALEVFGHRELLSDKPHAKTCPNISMDWIRKLLDLQS